MNTWDRRGPLDITPTPPETIISTVWKYSEKNYLGWGVDKYAGLVECGDVEAESVEEYAKSLQDICKVLKSLGYKVNGTIRIVQDDGECAGFLAEFGKIVVKNNKVTITHQGNVLDLLIEATKDD